VTGSPTTLVAAGYDAMTETWETWRAEIRDDPRAEWCDDLAARLAPAARVLELGCGGGTEETRLLAERFSVTAVDASVAQVRRARERVPRAEVLQADITTLAFAPGSFDAAVAFYSLNHVPRELLAGLFERAHSWLAPGGWFLATLGASDLPAWTGEWLGVPMFFSGWPAATNRELLRAAGFELVRDEVVAVSEPEGPVEFHWVLARR
jgi:SAM-dependent methyltransferase